MIARRLLDRGETQNAISALDAAIQLNSVNVAALDLKFQTLPPEAAALDRVTALLAVVRANPTRQAALAAMGRMLADVGLAKESVDWMQRAVVLYGSATNIDPQTYHDLLIDYVSAMYMLGQTQAATNLVEQLLKANPADVDARVLRLIIQRGGADKEQYAASAQETSAALTERWANTARQVTGQGAPPAEGADGAAAPAPPAGEVPEPGAVAKAVLESQDPAALGAFVSAVSDLAWFEIYFNAQPAAATKWIDALTTVLPEDSVTLTRLRGWLEIAENKPASAGETLGAIAETDPLAGLGVLLITPLPEGDDANRKEIDDRARKLLGDHRAGLVGAILAQALRERGLKPAPHPDAQAVRAELQKFNRAWLDVVDNPQRFYSIRVDPLRVAHRFGEPIYARVLIQNLSDQDISIGDDGLLKPGLWFDAEVSTMQSSLISGVAFERITQTTFIPARSAIAQYVRLDQGNLFTYLAGDPSPRRQITGWAMANPARRGQGFAFGPGGCRVPFARKITRVGFTAGKPAEIEKVVQELQHGLPEMKIRNISLLAAYARVIAARAAQIQQKLQEQPGAQLPPEQLQQLQQQDQARREFLDHLVDAAGDVAVPSVAQWAKFELARSGEKEQRESAVDSLITEPQWEGRLLGLIGTRFLPDAKMATDFADKVAAGDPEPCVKAYATEVGEVLRRPPPSTQPTDVNVPPAEVAPPAEVVPGTTPTVPAPEPAPEPAVDAEPAKPQADEPVREPPTDPDAPAPGVELK